MSEHPPQDPQNPALDSPHDTVSSDKPAPRAGKRIRPPDRRQLETRRIQWVPAGTPVPAGTSVPAGTNVPGDTNVPGHTSTSPALPTNAPVTLFLTIGYGSDLISPVEIFCDCGYRQGSDLDILCSDICIVLSILLQHADLDLDAFCNSLASERHSRLGEERFSSLIGLFLDEIRKPPKWATHDKTDAQQNDPAQESNQ